MVIGHGVALLPAQVEEDVDLAQVLAEFGTLPAIVTPIHDPQEEGVVPPAEYQTPKAHVDLFWHRLGRQLCLTMMCGHRLFANSSDDSGSANAGEELVLSRTAVG